MMRNERDPYESAVEKIEKRMERDPTYFTEDEYRALHKIVEAWRAMAWLGRGAKWVVVTLAFIVAGVTAGEEIMARVKAWLVG